jgi:GT2 family glycosyltransferase
LTDSGRSGDPVELERVRTELAERRRLEAELLREVAERDLELDRQRQDYTKLSDRAAADREAIGALRAEVAQLNTTSWQLFNALRQRLIALSGGQGSFGNRAVRKALRTAQAARHGRHPPPPIVLPEFSEPEVSLVMPLYSRADLTREALESICDETHRVPYEVILVDDTADTGTKALLATVQGARIITNETNLGYLRSVNRGAAAARGKWLVLCNNDIKFLYGWVGAMLDCANSAPDVAVVTPKYLYPDLALSEAGGVIWSDGTGGNYGRGEDPGESRFEYRREVDYGSAAALMVRADFWRSVGGYDERYIPMYYEDTDLCFAAREHGLRVLYEPRANVVHFEGATAGTDVNSGHKRYQEINRAKFVDKWRERLEREQLPPSRGNVRRAADRHPGPRVLILDHRVPMPDRDSGSLRLRAMIGALSDLGCRVTLFPEDLHMVLPYTLELMSAGIEVFYGDVNVPERIAEIGPELAMVITCRPHTTSKWLDLIRECAPSATVVYDTVDLHWLREARRAALGDGSEPVAPGSEPLVMAPKAVALREIELALIRATDATLVVSPEERAQVEADVPEATVRVVPNVNLLREHVAGPEGRSGLLFIGGYEHTPNVESAQRLVERVMPRVWAQNPEVKVTLIGGSVPAEVQQLASPRVDVVGWVENVEPLFGSALAMVAPLSYGAGLKGKVTQALAQGLPVVTTPIGAEGLDAVDGHQLLIGSNDDQLARRILRLLDDPELWGDLSRAGQELAAARCSPELVAAVLAELLGMKVPA